MNSRQQIITIKLSALFKEHLKVLDIVQLDDCIEAAKTQAVEFEFRTNPIPVVFTGNSTELKQRIFSNIKDSKHDSIKYT
jgi:methyl coenzyme M reductase subunit C-like uncharacterized protein (methanogenesis marker protein 7)